MSDNTTITTDASNPEDSRARLAKRLREAGLDTQRFITVFDGEKGTHNHTQYGPDSNPLRGNYGVYGGAGAGDDGEGVLIDVDVDDYQAGADDDGLQAVLDLPETLTVASPHTDGETGGHRYYAAPREVVDRLEDEFGKANPDTSWGEVQLDNQYVVGPGSQLDGCGKEWCDKCDKPNGGYYRIARDAPIARVDTEEFVAAVRPGVEGEKAEQEATLDDFEGVDPDTLADDGGLTPTVGRETAADDGADALDTDGAGADLTVAAEALASIDPDVARGVWLRLAFSAHLW